MKKTTSAMRGAPSYVRLVLPLLRDLAILAAVFLGVTALADALGAENLGTAATFGQIAFVIVLVGLLTRGRGPRRDP
jgi:hypothetical protein